MVEENRERGGKREEGGKERIVWVEGVFREVFLLVVWGIKNRFF